MPLGTNSLGGAGVTPNFTQYGQNPIIANQEDEITEIKRRSHENAEIETSSKLSEHKSQILTGLDKQTGPIPDLSEIIGKMLASCNKTILKAKQFFSKIETKTTEEQIPTQQTSKISIEERIKNFITNAFNFFIPSQVRIAFRRTLSKLNMDKTDSNVRDFQIMKREEDSINVHNRALDDQKDNLQGLQSLRDSVTNTLKSTRIPKNIEQLNQLTQTIDEWIALNEIRAKFDRIPDEIEAKVESAAYLSDDVFKQFLINLIHEAKRELDDIRFEANEKASTDPKIKEKFSDLSTEINKYIDQLNQIEKDVHNR